MKKAVVFGPLIVLFEIQNLLLDARILPYVCGASVEPAYITIGTIIVKQTHLHFNVGNNHEKKQRENSGIHLVLAIVIRL